MGNASKPEPIPAGCILTLAAAAVVGIAVAVITPKPSEPSPSPSPEAAAPRISASEGREALAMAQRSGMIDRHEMGTAGFARVYAGRRWESLSLLERTGVCGAALACYRSAGATGVRVIGRDGGNLATFDMTLGYRKD